MSNTQPFIIKCNDTLPSLSLSLQTKGRFNQIMPFNLTGVTATTFSMSDEHGNLKVSSSLAEITCVSGGTIQYNWIVGDTDEYGKYQGEFELFFTGGKKMSIPGLGYLDIHIIKDINGI